mmetsp:Transcript_18920/g.30384  ORF Transcript_18920/g.30384 Transcript_18920/m.30384 type:complete len:159 (+) Transcript_18920:258-734(+)
MSKLRCSAADIDIDKRFGRARGAHHPLVHGPEPKPWYPTVSLVKGSCAGDIGWNAAASEHQFFNRRHGAPDRYQMVSSGFRVGDAQSPLHTANGAYATDRHTLFSTIADRRFNRVDGGESSRRTFPSCQAYSLRLLLTPCLRHHMRRASQPSRGCRPR